MHLGEGLAAEVMRVIGLRDQYVALRAQPRIVVEPAILMMTQAIERGVNALGAGDVLDMLRAHADLKEFEK
jgi:hypothetical protein